MKMGLYKMCFKVKCCSQSYIQGWKIQIILQFKLFSCFQFERLYLVLGPNFSSLNQIWDRLERVNAYWALFIRKSRAGIATASPQGGEGRGQDRIQCSQSVVGEASTSLAVLFTLNPPKGIGVVKKAHIHGFGMLSTEHSIWWLV